MARIAVIGGGISGLSAAHFLQSGHDVTLFESRNKLGGHTDTHQIEMDGQTIDVDTGFIVFNDRTYPNFIKLIKSLGVDAAPTEMSFSVSGAGIEYNGHNLNTLFSERLNLLRPSFLRMVRDILRFNREARSIKEEDKSLDIGRYLTQYNYSDEFCDHYLLPMAAAIWSTGSEPVRQFPVSALVRFFEHHGLMDIRNRPQWRVLKNGSHSYVQEIAKQLKDVRLSQTIRQIRREPDNVILASSDGEAKFDYLVLAVHSDQALSLLSDPSIDEKRLLGKMKYVPNKVTLHTDSTIMPRHKRAWASWNYHLDRNNQQAALTYYMNRLQHLPVETPVLVTLNDPGTIKESSVIDRFEYAHPFYDHGMLEAQSHWDEISGQNRTYYAGAYWGNGFHEDGVVSAKKVCHQLGIES